MPDPRKITTPQTVNEIILDRSIRHGIYLVRLGGSEVKWLRQRLPALRRAVTQAIMPMLAELDGSELMSISDETLINRAAVAGSEAARKHLETITGESIRRLGEIAVAEADFERRLFEKAFPIEMNFTRPSNQFLSSVMKTEPISGKTMSGWFHDLSIQTRTAINQQIRIGLMEGESINDLLRRVRGRREFGFTDGIIGRVGEHATAIVRTGVMKASNRARQEFHMSNPDVVKGHQWILTLDSKTCTQCVHGESQNPYPPGNPPEVPAHPQCRCISAVITPSWQELGLDFNEPEPGVRASMDGEVPDSMTYEEWFDKLGSTDDGIAMQRDILGASRFEAYKKGVKVTAFADNGQILTLDQLRMMEPDLFPSIN